MLAVGLLVLLAALGGNVATDTGSLSAACASSDTDCDGLDDALETACGSDPNSASSTPERVGGLFAGVDDDGDTQIDEALPASADAVDCDTDGFIGAAESHVYSYKSQADGDQKVCGLYDTNFPDGAQSATPNLGWPIDFTTGGVLDSTYKVTITDLVSFLAPLRYIGTNVGAQAGDVRWDLSPGSSVFSVDINIQDLTALIAGSTGSPPMFGGIRAFSGPTCPWAPSVVEGGSWTFSGGSTGNVVQITMARLPLLGLGAADVSVAFDSGVVNVTICSTGNLGGVCSAAAPAGPARAAGFASPAITFEPVIIATLTLDCVGSPGASTPLTITVNELVDGTAGDPQTIAATVEAGTVVCG